MFGLQVKVGMPSYYLDTDEEITGEFGGEFGIDKGAYGNATVRLFARSADTENWQYIMEEDFVPVSFLILLEF